MDNILYGNEYAQEIKNEIKTYVSSLTTRKPQLAVIMVGDDEGAKAYVSSLNKAFSKVDIDVKNILMDNSIPEEELSMAVQQLNSDETIDGILLQMPLPKHINEEYIINLIDKEKDVDGLTDKNIARLYNNKEGHRPCTPSGIIELLKKKQIKIQGKEVVIIGRSKAVGKPAAMLFLNENATVTICHSKTKELAKQAAKADILIVAIGKEKFVTADFVKDGAIVIDVGTNIDKSGKLVGDVDFENVQPKCQWITPVPKGVGSMTTAILMQHVISSYQKRR